MVLLLKTSVEAQIPEGNSTANETSSSYGTTPAEATIYFPNSTSLTNNDGFEDTTITVADLRIRTTAHISPETRENTQIFAVTTESEDRHPASTATTLTVPPVNPEEDEENNAHSFVENSSSTNSPAIEYTEHLSPTTPENTVRNTPTTLPYSSSTMFVEDATVAETVTEASSPVSSSENLSVKELTFINTNDELITSTEPPRITASFSETSSGDSDHSESGTLTTLTALPVNSTLAPSGSPLIPEALPTTVPPSTVPPSTVPPTTLSPITVSPITVSPTTVSPTTVSHTNDSSPTSSGPVITPVTDGSTGSSCGDADVNKLLLVLAVAVTANVLAVILTAVCVYRIVSRKVSWDPPPIHYNRSKRGEHVRRQCCPHSGLHLASDRECKAGEGGGAPATHIPILITNEDGWCVPYSEQDNKKKGNVTEDTGV